MLFFNDSSFLIIVAIISEQFSINLPNGNHNSIRQIFIVKYIISSHYNCIMLFFNDSSFLIIVAIISEQFSINPPNGNHNEFIITLEYILEKFSHERKSCYLFSDDNINLLSHIDFNANAFLNPISTFSVGMQLNGQKDINGFLIH